MRYVLAAAAACFACVPASAAVFTTEAHFAPGAPGISFYNKVGVQGAVDLDTPVSGLSVGDTLEVTFILADRFTFINPPILDRGGEMLAGVHAANMAYNLGPATFAFVDATGDLIPSGPTEYFPGPDLSWLKIADRATFTTGSFSRLKMIYTIETVPATPILYAQIAFASGVPEPATWALMIAGFGLAGSLMRTRRYARSRRARHC